MRTNELEKIFELSIAQRILIVQEIWDSIFNNPNAVPLTDRQKQELDKRINSYYENPGAGSPWSEVKERILSAAQRACNLFCTAGLRFSGPCCFAAQRLIGWGRRPPAGF
ncbi:MAG: addiction module protein [Candidatus Aminicenantes bacterium]|nr:addiction module protein [Candidatus Aminicenantes bacterium]